MRILVVGPDSFADPWRVAASRVGGVSMDCAQTAVDDLASEVMNDANTIILPPLRSNEIEPACRLADEGKHLLIASPVADSIADISRLVEATRHSDVQLGVCETLRSAPNVRAVTDALAAGKLQRPGLLRVHRWNGSQVNTCAGQVANGIDLAMSIFAGSPTSVYAIERVAAEHALSNYLQVHLGFPGGGMALFSFYRGLTDARQFDSLSLIAANGAAYSDDAHNSHLLFRGNEATALVSAVEACDRAFELKMFCRAIESRGKPPVDGSSFIGALRVLEAINTAKKTEQAVQTAGGVQ